MDLLWATEGAYGYPIQILHLIPIFGILYTYDNLYQKTNTIDLNDTNTSQTNKENDNEVLMKQKIVD